MIRRSLVVLGFISAISTIVAIICLMLTLNREASAKSILINRSASVLIQDRNGLYLTELPSSDGEFGYWPIEKEIPGYLSQSVLAAEDKNFYRHEGLDLPAVIRAVWLNMTRFKRVSGASTIAMQTVRMSHPSGRTLWNKAVEMLAAVKMVKRYGRDAVLRHYLATAPMGNRGHGFAYASEKYFRKPIQDLNLAETALLSALPQAPGIMDLHSPKGRFYAENRARKILGRMCRNGFISKDQYDNSLEQLKRVMPVSKPFRPVIAMHAILKLEREGSHYQSGKILKASLDLNLQARLTSLARLYLDKFKQDGAQNTAVIVSDSSNGDILAYLGSANYSDEDASGCIDFADTPRSTGSTLKPFLYLLGMIQKEYSGSTILPDIGWVFPSGKDIYVPENSDRSFQGPVLYRYALANSRNVPAVHLLNGIGLQNTFDFFKYIGFVNVNDTRTADYYGLGMALGGLYVPLTKLTEAYGMLANDGSRFRLRWFQETNTNSLEKQEQVVPEDKARMVTLFLSDPSARLPSFPRMGNLEYPFAVAVKTGTSLGYRDSWAMAYTRKYVVGVWTGRADNQPMNRLTGGSGSGHFLRQIIGILHPEEMKGQINIPFSPPKDYIARQICPVSGKLAPLDSPLSVTEWFAPGTDPQDFSSVFKTVEMDTLTGEKAGPETPAEQRVFKVVADLPQEYAEWAKASGMETMPISALPDENGILDYSIAIQEPIDGSRIIIDNTEPSEYQTLALKAVVTPSSEQIVWYVDDAPAGIADYPYTMRWKISKGEHTFYAALPYSRVKSRPVTILVD